MCDLFSMIDVESIDFYSWVLCLVDLYGIEQMCTWNLFIMINMVSAKICFSKMNLFIEFNTSTSTLAITSHNCTNKESQIYEKNESTIPSI